MKVQFGGKHSGIWSPESGLIYEGKEVKLRRGDNSPRRVTSSDIVQSVKPGVLYTVLGRYTLA